MRNLFIIRRLLKYICLTVLFFCLFGCSDSIEDDAIFATIHGTVTDYETNAPIDNASVVLSPSGISKQTDANGYYRFDRLDVLQYTIIVQKSGYQANRKTIMSIKGETQQVDIQLTATPK